MIAEMIALSLSQANASPACDGFYSYVPQDADREVPFSVEVQDNRFVSVLFTDHGNIVARAQPTLTGVNFSDQGAVWRLSCAGERAQLVIPADQWSRERTFELQQTTGDIWAVARERGWEIGD